MTSKFERGALVVTETFLALTALAGMVGLLFEWTGLPANYLEGSPFSDYTVPALALGILVGGSAALAAVAVLNHHVLAAPLSAFAGVAIIFFEIVQLVYVPQSWLQWFYLGVGVVILGLTGSLWLGARTGATGVHGPA